MDGSDMFRGKNSYATEGEGVIKGSLGMHHASKDTDPFH